MDAEISLRKSYGRDFYPEYRQPPRRGHLVKVQLARAGAECPGGHGTGREDEVRYPVDHGGERLLLELGDGVNRAPDYLVLELHALGERDRVEPEGDVGGVEVPPPNEERDVAISPEGRWTYDCSSSGVMR